VIITIVLTIFFPGNRWQQEAAGYRQQQRQQQQQASKQAVENGIPELHVEPERMKKMIGLSELHPLLNQMGEFYSTNSVQNQKSRCLNHIFFLLQKKCI